MPERPSGLADGSVLVLGIGNVLMGDEGVGVEVVRYLERLDLPREVACLDGGTGGFQLLGPMHDSRRVLLIDATEDGQPPGALRRLRPRFSKDYPRTLTAHDIGLKDLLDAFYLIGDPPEVTLFAVSIRLPQEIGAPLSPELRERVPSIATAVLEELRELGHRVPL
jgi:hydrogenase maturation protease